MKYLARYMHRLSPAEYYKTIFADDVNEATRQAEKWRRKAYMLISVIEA